jgi:hypothetical protein
MTADPPIRCALAVVAPPTGRGGPASSGCPRSRRGIRWLDIARFAASARVRVDLTGPAVLTGLRAGQPGPAGAGDRAGVLLAAGATPAERWTPGCRCGSAGSSLGRRPSHHHALRPRPGITGPARHPHHRRPRSPGSPAGHRPTGTPTLAPNSVTPVIDTGAAQRHDRDITPSMSCRPACQRLWSDSATIRPMAASSTPLSVISPALAHARRPAVLHAPRVVGASSQPGADGTFCRAGYAGDLRKDLGSQGARRCGLQVAAGAMPPDPARWPTVWGRIAAVTSAQG